MNFPENWVLFAKVWRGLLQMVWTMMGSRKLWWFATRINGPADGRFSSPDTSKQHAAWRNGFNIPRKNPYHVKGKPSRRSFYDDPWLKL